MSRQAFDSEKKTLTIVVSGRALFNMEASHAVFEKSGVAGFLEYEEKHAAQPYEEGMAMGMVRKLLRFQEDMVRVVLISRNSGGSWQRLTNSLRHHGLDEMMNGLILTSGAPTAPMVKAIGADLFLSANPDQVRAALALGVPSAAIGLATNVRSRDGLLRIAFDADAVLFTDEAEMVYQRDGLDAFTSHERNLADRPLLPGPFMPLLAFCNRIQSRFADPDACPLRVALVTARSLAVQQRVQTSMQHMGVRVDEMAFMGGAPKGPVLSALGADIFFDDAPVHIRSALDHGVAAAHVPSGYRNAVPAANGPEPAAPEHTPPPAATADGVREIARSRPSPGRK